MGKLKSLCREAIFYIVTAKTIFAFSNKTRLCHNLKRNRLAVNILLLIINFIIYTFKNIIHSNQVWSSTCPGGKWLKKFRNCWNFELNIELPSLLLQSWQEGLMMNASALSRTQNNAQRIFHSILLNTCYVIDVWHFVRGWCPHQVVATCRFILPTWLAA